MDEVFGEHIDSFQILELGIFLAFSKEGEVGLGGGGGRSKQLIAAVSSSNSLCCVVGMIVGEASTSISFLTKFGDKVVKSWDDNAVHAGGNVLKVEVTGNIFWLA